MARVRWVDPAKLRANNYNPNHVFSPEMRLLKLSILAHGWTQPIVARSDGEIVDGFHRWTLARTDADVQALTGGLCPVVYLDGITIEEQMLATIRHNRARGQHGIIKMGEIVRTLLDSGMGPEMIGSLLQMEDEEVERLADTTPPEAGGYGPLRPRVGADEVDGVSALHSSLTLHGATYKKARMHMEGEYLSLPQAARSLPGSPSPTSVWRWCRKGIMSRSGERVHLGHVRIGGRMFVRERDLHRFFEAVASADMEYFQRGRVVETLPIPHGRTPQQRMRDIEEAERELGKRGVPKAKEEGR